MRTEKTVNGVTTKYHVVDNKVTFETKITPETNEIENIYYTYDSDDNLISMELNGVEYYYVRNAQGDIIGLVDSNGVQVVIYTYDSGGKLISIDGSLKDTLGIKNPYRYRGYRYDNETGLYYLQNRYYNYEWGRFLNADATLGSIGELLSYNMFIYVENNPIMNRDTTGYILETAIDIASIGNSAYNFMKNPSWRNVGYLVWDSAAAALPFVPGSYTVKGGKLLLKLKKGAEVALPKVKSYEQARNITLKIVGGLLGRGSKPLYGTLKRSAGYDKIVGRQSADNSVSWRVDYDPVKGTHINIMIGKNKPYKIVIPFQGTEKTFKSILKTLNR
jgi:RHS repeat-associated protein